MHCIIIRKSFPNKILIIYRYIIDDITAGRPRDVALRNVRKKLIKRLMRL